MCQLDGFFLHVATIFFWRKIKGGDRFQYNVQVDIVAGKSLTGDKAVRGLGRKLFELIVNTKKWGEAGELRLKGELLQTKGLQQQHAEVLAAYVWDKITRHKELLPLKMRVSCF